MLQASHPHRNSDNDSLALTTRFIKFTQTEIKEVSVKEKKRRFEKKLSFKSHALCNTPIVTELETSGHQPICLESLV
jgi:hypothetical protein